MRYPNRSVKRHRLVHLLASLPAGSSIIAGFKVVSLKFKIAQVDIWNSLISTAVIVGNYLWIHGGELTTWNCTGSGFGSFFEADLGNVTTLINSNTYSIDLSSSWTNATVELTSTHSEAPGLVGQALWVDPSGTFFYAYDGGGSSSANVPKSERPPPSPNELWQFNPSGKSGNWFLVGPPASSNFTKLIRGYNGIYTSGAGLGFALGGVENSETNDAIEMIGGSSFLIPGMVMYNITSEDWYNVSASGYSHGGVAVDGVAQFVPSFGPAGLLFVFGGSVGSIANEVLPGTDSVSIFEPISQQWWSQDVSGAKPSSVLSPCVVGAQGDNNTYEIFLYGCLAENTNDTIAQGAVYVLSLPAFNWQKQNITPEYDRWLHSCNVIGNRQMVSIGGLVTNISLQVTTDGPISNAYNSIPDPWPQGLGIFDLTAMEWEEEYDPAAAPYVTPDAVKAYYHQNGRDPAFWSNGVVQAWFTENPPSHTNSSSSPSKPQTGLPRSPGSLKSNIGAIAGGSVGGIAGLVLIALLALFLLRRRRRRRSGLPVLPFDTGSRRPKLENNGNNNVPGVSYPLAEMQGIDDPIEMPGSEVPPIELPS